MKMKQNARVVFGLIFALSLTTGCKAVFERLDCQTMCESYKDCTDSDLKVSDCTDDCFDAIDGDKDLEKDADKCASCIDDYHDRTCSEVSEDCDHCEEVFSVFMGGASGT